MKKTLFILMALASVATAEEPSTSSNTYTVDGNASNNNKFVYEVPAKYDKDGEDIIGGESVRGFIRHAVHVGKSTVIYMDESAKTATTYEVTERGTLVFVGQTVDGELPTTTEANKTVQDILTETTGAGNLVLRTPEQYVKTEGNNMENSATALKFDYDGTSQMTGNLILSPVPVEGYGDGAVLYQQSHVEMTLKDNADISSFSSVLFGSALSTINIDGQIAKDESAAGHINNLTLAGASDSYLRVRHEKAEVHLGGTTVVEGYDYQGSPYVATQFVVNYLKHGNVILEALEGNTPAGETPSSIKFEVGEAQGTNTTPINAKFSIDSFDHNGLLYLWANAPGSITGSITLLRNDAQNVHQKLYDYQVQGTKKDEVASNITLELSGAGTYVLSDGMSMLTSGNWSSFASNFATLSSSWKGTVEVNRLDDDIDFSDYGNTDSTVHFKGFEGAVDVRSDKTKPEITAATSIDIAPDIILENAPASGSDAAMSAFELTGAPDGTQVQKLNFTGNISGDGDFVLNSDVKHEIEFKGQVRDWAAGDETPSLTVKKGKHSVKFSADATEINADILTSDQAELDVTFAQNGSATVNSTISHAAGGTLGVSVDTSADVTFKTTVDVDSANVKGKAKLNGSTLTAGNVGISGRTDTSVAELSSGVQVSADSVSGSGSVAHAELDLAACTVPTISEVTLDDTTVKAAANQSVKLSGVKTDKVAYNNVLLSGTGATYAVQDGVNDVFTADPTDSTKVSLTTDALSGMTLAADSKISFTLAESAVSGWAADDKPVLGDTLQEINITLNGFVMDYVVKNSGTKAGAVATLTTQGNLLENLTIENSLLETLDFSKSIVTYHQLYSATGGLDSNMLTINIKQMPVRLPSFDATTHNGRAGAKILSAAYDEPHAPGGLLSTIFDAALHNKISDWDMAAVAGASTTVLGQALSGDIERQLRAIRNRSLAGTYGCSNTLAFDGKHSIGETPHKYFAWVNAEGNRGEQDPESTAPGYTLDSWGGTLGAGMQVNDQLTLGLALTAMYGDLKSDGPDRLDGDLDTAYISAYARYTENKWSHALIATIGSMDSDYTRTVHNAAGSYHTTGDTNGSAFGFLYELSRDYEIDEQSSIAPVLNISYRHTAVDSFSERGGEAALRVDRQSLDTATLGAGARYSITFGEDDFNCPCRFEARALAKYDFGDTQSDMNIGFLSHHTRANIESAEQGAFGLELGAGVSVPVGRGSFFLDGTFEFRSDYTNFNATIGYGFEF